VGGVGVEGVDTDGLPPPHDVSARQSSNPGIFEKEPTSTSRLTHWNSRPAYLSAAMQPERTLPPPTTCQRDASIWSRVARGATSACVVIHPFNSPHVLSTSQRRGSKGGRCVWTAPESDVLYSRTDIYAIYALQFLLVRVTTVRKSGYFAAGYKERSQKLLIFIHCPGHTGVACTASNLRSNPVSAKSVEVMPNLLVQSVVLIPPFS
jgi:hypothetical protein